MQQVQDLRQKAIDMLLRIRRECCDGKTGIEIDNETSIVLGYLQKNGLIIGTLSIWVPNELYCGVTDKGREMVRKLGAY